MKQGFEAVSDACSSGRVHPTLGHWLPRVLAAMIDVDVTTFASNSL